MIRRDPETWLWELSRLPREGSSAELTEVQVEAYRAGRLSPDEARRVEAALAASPADRRRLLELARVGQRPLSPELRRRVLATTGRRRAFPWRLAASLAVLALGSAFVWAMLTGTPHPNRGPLPKLEGGIAALAEVRSAGTPARTVRAYPSTPVSITLTVPADPVPGLEFALYRFADGGLQRLSAPDVETIVGRGIAELSGKTSDLVGSAPGRYTLVGAMGWEGELPAGLRERNEAGARRALEEAGARVVVLELELLAVSEQDTGNP